MGNDSETTHLLCLALVFNVLNDCYKGIEFKVNNKESKTIFFLRQCSSNLFDEI